MVGSEALLNQPTVILNGASRCLARAIRIRRLPPMDPDLRE